MRRLIAALIAGLVLAIAVYQVPQFAAGGLLYPSRQADVPPAPDGCREDVRQVAGISLSGWRCAAEGQRRGTIIYLHGIADNRGSAAGAIRRYRPRGFDVLAYDSRNHGRSGGDVCTYGYYEKQDARSLIDSAPSGPVILLGTSLGAAVALQAAADDTRVSTVIAAEVFSDLRTVAIERAPSLLPHWAIDRAFAIAESRGHFQVADVSPVKAATRLTIPVLLIHGADDLDTRPDHSNRVFEALRGRRRLLLVSGAGHNHSLSAEDTCREIDGWIEAIVGADS
jgi:pimeloyl-ACP methyl ester carboxylesterase